MLNEEHTIDLHILQSTPKPDNSLELYTKFDFRHKITNSKFIPLCNQIVEKWEIKKEHKKKFWSTSPKR